MKLMNHFVGTVGTQPRKHSFENGEEVASFRMAVNYSVLNTETGAFVDKETTWFEVQMYGSLATHATSSLVPGMNVVVVGRLRVREWSTDQRNGTTIQIVASAVGVNLRFGEVRFTKVQRTDVATPATRGADADAPVADRWGGMAQAPGRPAVDAPGTETEDPGVGTHDEDVSEPVTVGVGATGDDAPGRNEDPPF